MHAEGRKTFGLLVTLAILILGIWALWMTLSHVLLEPQEESQYELQDQGFVEEDLFSATVDRQLLRFRGALEGAEVLRKERTVVAVKPDSMFMGYPSPLSSFEYVHLDELKFGDVTCWFVNVRIPSLPGAMGLDDLDPVFLTMDRWHDAHKWGVVFIKEERGYRYELATPWTLTGKLAEVATSYGILDEDFLTLEEDELVAMWESKSKWLEGFISEVISTMSSGSELRVKHVEGFNTIFRREARQAIRQSGLTEGYIKYLDGNWQVMPKPPPPES